MFLWFSHDFNLDGARFQYYTRTLQLLTMNWNWFCVLHWLIVFVVHIRTHLQMTTRNTWVANDTVHILTAESGEIAFAGRTNVWERQTEKTFCQIFVFNWFQWFFWHQKTRVKIFSSAKTDFRCFDLILPFLSLIDSHTRSIETNFFEFDSDDCNQAILPNCHCQMRRCFDCCCHQLNASIVGRIRTKTSENE